MFINIPCACVFLVNQNSQYVQIVLRGKVYDIRNFFTLLLLSILFVNVVLAMTNKTDSELESLLNSGASYYYTYCMTILQLLTKNT